MINDSIYIHGYRLQLTCFACPEQYDVFDPKGNQVGYIRLRHGTLRVYSPDYGGKLLLETTNVIGDGIFDKTERYQSLYYCVELIQREVLEKMFESLTEDLPPIIEL